MHQHIFSSWCEGADGAVSREDVYEFGYVNTAAYALANKDKRLVFVCVRHIIYSI